MGMIGIVIPVVGGILGLVGKIYKTVQGMDQRLAEIEFILKENRR